MKNKVTEDMIVAYLKAAGGYKVYEKALDDLYVMRQTAIDMIEQFNGNVDEAVDFVKEQKRKIIANVPRSNK